MAARKRTATRRAYRDRKYGRGYDAFRTGLTFAQALRMISGPDHDPSRWPKCRNRRAVLGFMHETKRRMWEELQRARESSERIPF